MSAVVAAGLAGAAAAVLVGGVPSAAAARLAGLVPGGRRRPARPSLRVLLVTAVLAVAVLLGAVVAALGALSVVLVLRVHDKRRHHRSAAAERRGAAQACRVLAAELSAGRAPEHALAAAAEPATGPCAAALRSAAAAASLGGDVPATLVAGADGSAVEPLLRALAACWAVCAASGSGLAAAVQRLEEGLQADAELQRTLDAELAGPRATAMLLAVLPGAGLLMAAGLGADPLHLLLATPAGLVCLVTGLALDGLGLLWTQRLVARVRP